MKKILFFTLVLAILCLSTSALGAEIRQFSITSDTTVDEFLEDVDWSDTKNDNIQSKKFTEIVNTVADSYFFGTTQDDLFATFTDGSLLRVRGDNIDIIYDIMFNSLDRFSYYARPVFYTSIWDEPYYGGYGIVIHDSSRNKYSTQSEGLFIEEIYSDSPAEDVGILPGDKIISVNGIKVENLSISALYPLLTFYTNFEDCKMTVLRGEQYVDFTMRKRDIATRELMASFIPQYSTAKFDITAFQSSTLEGLMEDVLKETKELGYKNVIVDLRDNPGGVIDFAMKATDLFITKKHTLFKFVNKDNVPFMQYDSDKKGYTFDNLYILVNENTASAAEAMAISLQQLAGGKIVGTKTFGKEIGQVLYKAVDNSTYAVTTIKGYGPNGEDYNNIGIEPDCPVELKTEPFKLPDNYLPLKKEDLSIIKEGNTNDAIRALEQRFNIVGFLPEKYIDGIYDENLDACIKLLQTIKYEELKTFQPILLEYLDKTIEGLNGKNIQKEDTQLDYIMNEIINAK